jgi:hypothetical protein
MNEHDIIELIRRDPWMMRVLRTAATLELPDWMIGGGFVRNKVWDHLHGFNREQVDTNDIDLVYFDPLNADEAFEKELDRQLREKIDLNWSTKNQARMHTLNNNDPYESTLHAMAHWPETPTCVGVALADTDVRFFAPHGIDDLVNLRIRMCPLYRGGIEKVCERVEKKHWLEKWPKLQFVT